MATRIRKTVDRRLLISQSWLPDRENKYANNKNTGKMLLLTQSDTQHLTEWLLYVRHRAKGLRNPMRVFKKLNSCHHEANNLNREVGFIEKKSRTLTPKSQLCERLRERMTSNCTQWRGPRDRITENCSGLPEKALHFTNGDSEAETWGWKQGKWNIPKKASMYWETTSNLMQWGNYNNIAMSDRQTKTRQFIKRLKFHAMTYLLLVVVVF